MTFEEGGKISADSCMEMEPLTGFEIIKDNIDSVPSKVSCLEETSVLEVKDSSCQASCLDKGVCCEFKDVMSFPPVNLSLFDSTIHFQNDGFTETSSSSSDQTEDDEMVLEIETPTKSIFDPFAPGTDDLMLAPKKKKLRNSYVPFRRRLDFNAGSESKENVEGDSVKDFDEEEQIFESVFNSLFEMIISIQLKEISAETMVTDSDLAEDCKTPLSLTLLSSNTEACPPAPMKPKLILERQSHNLCRKLDFGNNFN
ncbi:uncharacterized protein LOC110104556 [Dendrobium catenatum]|uniref:Uncharacterized protein n=1 Tax=Dendrobium catenatum TaxID=906689 RepID=A0A2I0WR22_9ASPA|nr:uncharacterized protein LOC110104556 [Dendrobium catenatum]PKU78097.1 hypothetical protein MA16_Dca013163 [Dendrobium catenatum]